MIEAHDIRVTLRGREILHGMDMTAQPGTVTAIVGPNGSGKTTFLKALTGEVSHTGKVRVNGRDAADYQPWELAAERAVLPQAAQLAFPFTVIEVVRMGLMRGTSAEDDRIPMAALRRVGLAHYAQAYCQDLSGGEQQRVHLARVLAQVWAPVEEGRPRWLFLDEPVASLDIGHQLEVLEVVRDFAAAGGGVIAVMHDLNLTAMMAEQVMVIREGRVLIAAPPQEALTSEVLSEAYQCRLSVSEAPSGSVPFLLPQCAGEDQRVGTGASPL